MTDHAAEAQKHIDWVHGWQETEGSTEKTNLANALVAQAEATLAMVEQARIANLVALATAHHIDEAIDMLAEEARAALVEWVPTGLDDEHPRIVPEVAAALGIGTTS